LALSERSQKTLRTRIDAIRRTAETTTLTDDTRKRLAQALDRSIATVEHRPLQSVTFTDIAERLAAGYRDARRAMPENWSDSDGEALHELRKRIVRHRYQMEIVVPFWKNFGAMWIDEAQRLRTSLGKHQDLLLLTRCYAIDNCWRDAQVLDKRPIQDFDAAALDGSHRQLFLTRHPELPNQENIQVHMQSFRDFKPDWDTAARKSEDKDNGIGNDRFEPPG